jgi:hypothetical protein
MGWNYRIYRHAENDPPTFALHERYLGTPHGDVEAKEPATSHYSSVAELIEALELMLGDAKRCQNDVLEWEP